MKHSRVSQIYLGFAAAVAALLLSCKGTERSKPAGLDGEQGSGGSTIDACIKHSKGCPCSDEGATSACGSIKEKVGDYVICSKGVRVCSGGEWGECVAESEEKKLLSHSAPMQGGFTLSGLGTGTSCDNLCDPECVVLEDTPTGLVVPTDLFVNDTGVTLPSGGGGGSSCDDISISPTSDSITITDIATDGTITASPSSRDFNAYCSSSAEVQPSWTIDSYDRAVVDSNGKVTVYSGIAGPIKVTGSSATDDASATLNVKVAMEDRGSSTATALLFDVPGTVADSGKTLYPYKNTVFPLDLQAPMVQWQRGDTSATANTATEVQVALAFPAGCAGPTALTASACTFWYSKIHSGEPACSSTSALAPCLNTAVPAWQIPQNVWSAFDRTAAGDATGGEIIIQRKYGGTVKKEMKIPVKFATDSLKGTVYYTQYKRYMKSTSCTSTAGGTPITAASYVPGTICPVGPCTQDLSGAGSATTRAIDLSSSTSSNIDPFNGTAGCPVCHSVSADGSRHVSVNQSQQTFGGGTSKGVNNISSLMGDTTFTPVGTAPNYGIGSTSSEPNGEQSFGFAYGALFPDGSRTLQGSMYWGNTEDIPSGGNNTQNASDTGVTGFPKPYFVVDTDQPGAGVQFATTAALPANSYASNAITASAAGTLTIDGVNMGSTGYSVLVKDETTTARNGVYTVTTVGTSSVKWKLTRRGDADSSAELKKGTEVRISDGYSMRGKVFYVSSDTPTTIGTSSIVFTQRPMPAISFSSSALAANYGTTAALTPATVTLSGNVLTGGSPATLTIDGHNMALNETVLVKDQATAAQNGVYKVTTLAASGTGTPLTSLYATTAALPTNTRSSNVLTASATGALVVDGATPALNDSVLVKNEVTGAHNGLYTVSQLGSGTGTALTAQYATAAALPTHTQSGNILSGYGPVSVDGTTLGVNASVLVKNESTASQNGIYTLTAVGTGGSTALPSVKYGSTANLSAAFTATGVLQGSSFGALTLDGATVASGDAVLLKDQTDQKQNGVYTLTTVGTGGTTSLPSVKYASTANLSGSFTATGVFQGTTYGPLSIDGSTVASGEAVLLKDQTDQKQNGVYTLTTVATGGSTALPSVKYASTANLAGAFTSTGVLQGSSLGPLVIDGATVASGEAVLLKDQTDQKQNGVYTLTTVPGGGTTQVPTVKYASTANLAGAFTGTGVFKLSTPGPVSIDGSVLASGEAVLLKDQTDQKQNGIYTLSTVPTGGAQVQPAVKYASTANIAGSFTSTGVLTLTNYGPLTIDGSVLASTEAVLLKDQTDQKQNGIYTLSTAPNGGTQTQPAVAFASTTNLSAAFSAVGVLRASANGFLSMDGSGNITTLGTAVLLKNQTNPKQNGVYTLTVAGSASARWTLTRRVDAPVLAPSAHVPVTGGTTNGGKAFYVSTPSSGALTYDTTNISFTQSTKGVLSRRSDSPALAPNAQVAVTNGTANAGRAYYVSTPSSGSITYDSTNIAFTQSTFAVLSRRSDSPALAPSFQVPVSSGTANAGKTYYVSTPSSGSITYDSTAIALTQSAKWVLSRRSDSPALAATFQVPVTNGTANAGKTYYVSTPATGAITYDTTNIAFTQSTRWVLTRRSDSPALAATFQVPVTNGAANSGKTYYVSTPASGAISYDSTAIAFTQSAKWVLTRRTDSPALAPTFQVPITNGTANAGKTYYVSTPATGTVTYDTTNIAFTQSTPWTLERRSPDNDTTGDITPGQQVSISSGSTNANKIFYVSAPASGTITLNTTAITYSQATVWKLTRHTSADNSPAGEVFPGLQVTVSSGTANAGKTFFISEPSTGTVTLNTTPLVFSLSTSWQMTRIDAANDTGEIVPGQEVKVSSGPTNASKVFYVSSPTSGTITINTTAISYSETGLPTMMVPTFSPDGTKVAYVNGDSDIVGGLPATGWRRGLSMFSFAWNATNETFTVSNKKRLINNYDSTTPGVVVKWPFFESDSRSLVYVESETTDFCSSTDINSDVSTNVRRACSQEPYASALGARGNMTPTARGGWAGKIFSIDTSASTPASTRVELSKLNDADDDGGTDDSVDGDKAYQPTVLPFAAGDKRWVIFTSTRAYGNQVNPKSWSGTSYGTATHFTCSAPMLWMSALTNSTADGSDRSNPAFFLPGQKTALPTASNDYINERGYLVPSPCKADGVSCTTDDECCGADTDPATAACRAPAGWTPADGAPAKACEGLSGTCHNASESCTTSEDCCNGAQCVNFECAEPGDFEAASFTREYVSDCPVGYHADWQLFRFHLTTEGDSNLHFWAQTAKNLDDLDAATLVDLGSSTDTVVNPANPAYIDVGAALDAKDISRHFSNLRIIIDFNPSSDNQAAPILHDWEQRFTCAPAE